MKLKTRPRVVLFFLLMFSQSVLANETELLGVQQECQASEKRGYFPKQVLPSSRGARRRYSQVKVKCDSDYIQFASTLSRSGKRKSLKLGSFNLWRAGNALGYSPLGDGHTPFKNYEMLAKILDRSDIVAVQELFALNKLDNNLNEKFDRALDPENLEKIEFSDEEETAPIFQSGQHPNPSELKKILQASYVVPAYVRILNQLRKLNKSNPSWSLILSPRGLGRASAKDGKYYMLELSGFFYRADVVEPVGTHFCPGQKIACLVPFDKKYDEHFERSPFAASFKMRGGDFDFTLITHHSRYDDSADPEVFKRLIRNVSPKLLGYDPDTWTKEERLLFGRIAELKVLMDRVGELRAEQKEKDIIVLGDFNLDLDPSLESAWKVALSGSKGTEAFVTDASTLGFGPGSESHSYDHFIFDPALDGASCEGDRASALSFVQNPVNDWVEDYKNNASQIRQEMEMDYRTRLKFESRNDKILTRRHSSSSVEKVLGFFDQTVRGDNGPYEMHRNLLSDHLPIEMKCEMK